MATNIPKISSRFETTLSSSMAKGASSFNITSGTDKAGNALSGIYGFVIDNGSSTEEFVIGSVSGTAVTSVATGLDPANPQTTVAALQQSHRKGASVKITDYPILAYLREILNGNAAYTIDNVLSYTTHPTFTSRTQLADKGYADDIIVGAVPSASTTVAGTVKITTATGTVVSTDDTRVPTAGQAAALASTTTPAASNKYMSQKDFQNAAEVYVASTGSANAYVVSYSPGPTALIAGMVLRFKANFANTGPATIAVNGGSAQAIKKAEGATALASGDIASGQNIEMMYDGTNFQLLNPVANAPTTIPLYKLGTTTRVGNAASGAQTIAHGLGVIPKLVRFSATYSTGNGGIVTSSGSYNGTTNGSVWAAMNAAASASAGGNDNTNAIHMEVTTGGTNLAVATFDATNITLTWTLATGPGANNINILWEAFA